DHIGHVSWTRRDGSMAGCLMWIDWDGNQLLTSSPVGTAKGKAWRRDPHVLVSTVDRADDWRYVRVSGRVTEIRPDVDLVFIDRMSERYLGSPYGRRSGAREIFVITPDEIQFGHGGWARRRSP
ncbi:MAG TPA: pyridoxamine 5'-phosphate oxidase family protein, partial [Candidatus Limnocylindrales bacterium]|nr:pyridoxamine 5'-phosphate oxidase family protein [Candidatus Limnocylindrales bacterium]